jgi:hypothetical protein
LPLRIAIMLQAHSHNGTVIGMKRGLKLLGTDEMQCRGALRLDAQAENHHNPASTRG